MSVGMIKVWKQNRWEIHEHVKSQTTEPPPTPEYIKEMRNERRDKIKSIYFLRFIL